ncbi:unnamed protein product [Adineta steineri]|uniref:Nucleoporin Nup159/Nup146 N-terminal domain-containing protein n=1 Tax=Adineta steineri TaxID=433720 RepID=A0A818R9U2_9BILA|nr:unnamed protein product [Adineta steineri]
MEDAQEKDMDQVASFKSGKSLTITGKQYNVCSKNPVTNILASSNRYGYVFYATETDGLAIIPSGYIDQESHHLSKTSDDDPNDNINTTFDKNSIIRRSYLPGQAPNQNPSLIPYWLSLNADESILAIILLQLNTAECLIILYDVVKLIQTPNSALICPPIRLPQNAIGDSIQSFAWNPANPIVFAYIDGLGSVSCFEIDKQLKPLGQILGNGDNSSICWSPKGKQIVVAKYDGALELYEPNMQLKKKYPSAIMNPSYPPCINVLWLSTHQFLLAFSENSPEEGSNENSFFHILVTYNKDQTPKTQIYNDLFFDTDEASMDINPQYYYVRLNETKIIITGLSKSLKINVLGPDELNAFRGLSGPAHESSPKNSFSVTKAFYLYIINI